MWSIAEINNFISEIEKQFNEEYGPKSNYGGDLREMEFDWEELQSKFGKPGMLLFR